MEINWEALSAIGTLGATIGTLVTIRFIKQQVSASYKPELYLNNINEVFFYGGKNAKGENHLSYGSKEEYFGDKNPVELEIFNLGLGAATSIKYSWEFNQIKSVQLINDCNDNNLFEVVLQEHLTGITSFGFLKSIGMKVDFDEKRINFIEQNKPIRINIPRLYCELYLIFFVLRCGYYDSSTDKSKIYNSKLDEFPSLFLSLYYKDIAGNNYKKKFKFDFEHYESSDPSQFDSIYSFSLHNLDCVELPSTKNIL